MVSNFERIFDQIKRESNLVAPTHRLNPSTVVELIMQIVDLEDQHRIRSVARIHQRVKGKVQAFALGEEEREDV